MSWSSRNLLPRDIHGRPWTSIVIEFTWLSALVLVPIVYEARGWLVFPEQPKQLVLHFAVVMIVVVWAIEIAVGANRQRNIPSLPGWAGRSVARWAVIAVALFGAAQIASTVFSRAPLASTWGRDYFSLGYELYSFLALLILFMAIALRLRGREQIQRVLYAIVLTGTLTSIYGVSQHFGWDPYGVGAGVSRVPSTFLNPIFFGSFLVMSLPITLAVALLKSADEKRLWTLFAIAIGVQLAALWFTGSRGPLFGATVGGLALIIVAMLRLERTVLLRGLIVSIGGLVTAGVLVALPGGESRGTGSLIGGFADTGQFGASLVGGSSLLGSGLNDRVGLWQGAAELAIGWDVESPDTGISSTLRPVFGLGPKMYKYSYPLVVEPTGPRNADNPHNYVLNILVEMGVVGLATLLAIVASIVTVLIRLLWTKPSSQTDPWVTIVAVGLTAALVGRGVEQMAGIARLADLVPYWMLLGLVVALSESVSAGATADVNGSPRRREQIQPGRIQIPSLVTISAALVVSVVVVGIFITKDIQQFRGGRAIVNAANAINDGDAATGLEKFRQGIDLAPDVTYYPILLDHWLGGPRPGTSQENERALLEIRYDTLAKTAQGDPYNFNLRERLAALSLQLLEDGDEGRRGEVIARYVELGRALPNYADIQGLSARVLLSVESFDHALATADRWITIGENQSLAEAWWVRAVVQIGLGDETGAFDSFGQATEIRPENEWSAAAHSGLALILEGQGRFEEASEHRARRTELIGG